MSEEFKLDPADIQTHIWRKLADHMKTLLANAREQNDDISSDAISTAKTRGRIAMLKELLALETDPAHEVDED